jgi:hypothetical protein
MPTTVVLGRTPYVDDQWGIHIGDLRLVRLAVRGWEGIQAISAACCGCRCSVINLACCQPKLLVHYYWYST